MAVAKSTGAERVARRAAPSTDSRTLVRQHVANEIIFAVVGPVGSGTSEIAEALEEFLKKSGYATALLRAREVIETWSIRQGRPIPKDAKMVETKALQDAGDKLREETKDNAAVALRLIDRIRATRASQKGESAEKGKPVDPDVSKRAFILDSLRHPAEVALLRSTYQDAFCLIGVVCEEDIRKPRLRKKFSDAGDDAINLLMRRDEKDDKKFGQQVADTFHYADFFVDNSASRFNDDAGESKANPAWTAVDELGRLVDILMHQRVVRPRPSETAMFHAYGARMRSSCLSRQVGAALMDEHGEIVATGTNEVPKAGGGVYGGIFADSADIDPPPMHDHRCFLHGKYCRNTTEQNEIIKDLFANVPELKSIDVTQDLIKVVRKTRIGQLIEFSRSVHAEMDALLSAARQGVPLRGTRLFVTTFPCHNCARHIVSAGVDEVQFVEPYLKSKALPLHNDAITTSREGWTPPSGLKATRSEKGKKAPQVLFRPFVAVAPRLYRRAFYKDRELKDETSGALLTSFGPPEGVGVTEALRVSYAQMEASLAASVEETDQ